MGSFSIRLSLIAMGRQPKGTERYIDDKILSLVQAHRTGVTYGDLREESGKKIQITPATFALHIKKLRRLGALSKRDGLYFWSSVWALHDANTGYTSSKLSPEGNLYISLLLALTTMMHHYLALLQAVVDAPNISTAHEMADFFLRNTSDSEIMSLVRRVWESKGNVRVESLIGKKMTLEFVKGRPPTGGVSVRGASGKSA